MRKGEECLSALGLPLSDLTEEEYIGFFGVPRRYPPPMPHHKKDRKEAEKELECLVGSSLASQGVSVQYQVRCKSGVADIVTPDAIYEIKLEIKSHSQLFRAIAQVLSYCQQINPDAKSFVISGNRLGLPPEQLEGMRALAQSMGVEFIVWEETGDQINE